MHTLKPRRTNKADQVMVLEILARNKLWERVYPRSAARAALDLTGAKRLSAYTCKPPQYLEEEAPEAGCC